MNAHKWLSREVLLISLSAFFADLGYQSVVGLLPIYITGILEQKPYVFGLIMALTYGIGSFISYAGGRLGDRLNKRRVALAGNLLIPLLSFSGLPANAAGSAGLYMGGWFARDFRSPPRRAMLVEASDPAYRSNVFGMLHALDVGGGTVSAFLAFVFLSYGVPIGQVMLFSAVPIIISSIVLFMTKGERNENYARSLAPSATAPVRDEARTSDRRLFLAAVALFGFSYYSLGFPIITVSSETGSYALGIATYAVFLFSSGLSGLFFGSMKLNALGALWKLGYTVAALGSLFLAVSYQFHAGVLSFYMATAVLGLGAGVIETYEPVVTASLSPHSGLSRGLGALSQWRSIGLFTSNLLMGLLFTVSVFSSYLYAFVTAITGAVMLAILAGRTRTG